MNQPVIVHVCLISGQPIPNFLPLLLEKPQNTIFIVSPEMRIQAERLEKVVRSHNIEVEICPIESAFDYDEVLAFCEHLLASGGNRHISLNVTGGTKIAALAAYQAFFFAGNNRIFYCDTEHDRLLQMSPESSERKLSTNLITVRDYLSCYGLPQIGGGTPPTGSSKRQPHLSALATLLVQNENLLSRLNSAIESCGNKQYANISMNLLGEGAEKLAVIFEQCGVAKRTGGNNLNISSKESLFFCKGGWLEEFVYWTIKKSAANDIDLSMNVKVAWDETGKETTENEFDVLFTHRNRLHLISCKASNPERQTASGTRATEALNELDSLIDRAGGLFGRPMMVSARCLSEFDRSRAAKMGIHLVDGQEVLRLDSHLSF